jgi:hypothetical protein
MMVFNGCATTAVKYRFVKKDKNKKRIFSKGDQRMKKNKPMRLASALLVVTLLTTSMISSTFAKYVSSDSGSDTARVAKWGITVSASGDLFGTTYKQASDNTIGTGASGETLTVKSSGTDKVVAPGTQNTTGVTFKVNGTPEVSYIIEASSLNVKDVFIAAGTYQVTKGDKTQIITLTENYSPIVYTLKKGSTTVTGDLTTVTKALTDGLQGITSTQTTAVTHDSNKEADTEYTLTWAWAFNSAVNDELDTLLGDLADGATLKKQDTGAATFTNDAVAGTDYNLNPNYEIAITVTQVD